MGYIVMLRARMFRSLIIRTGIKERNIRARNWRYNRNMLSKHHRDSPPLATASRGNLSKFVVIEHFGWESMNIQPSCCLNVVLYMLNCVFWRHIQLKIEFKSRVDNQYTAQRYNP